MKIPVAAIIRKTTKSPMISPHDPRQPDLFPAESGAVSVEVSGVVIGTLN
jgi:hypothetical protein